MFTYLVPAPFRIPNLQFLHISEALEDKPLAPHPLNGSKIPGPQAYHLRCENTDKESAKWCSAP